MCWFIWMSLCLGIITYHPKIVVLGLHASFPLFNPQKREMAGFEPPTSTNSIHIVWIEPQDHGSCDQWILCCSKQWTDGTLNGFLIQRTKSQEQWFGTTELDEREHNIKFNLIKISSNPFRFSFRFVSITMVFLNKSLLSGQSSLDAPLFITW